MPELNLLSRALCELPDEAKAEQVQASMREWQNFQARWHVGAVPNSDQDAMVEHNGTPGTLEVRLDVDQYDPLSRKAHVWKVALPGASDTALEYFRRNRPTIAEFAVNKLFYLEFGGTTVKVAQGPDSGLRFDDVEREDLQILKAYAAGDVIDGTVRYRIERNPEYYDATVDDGRAIAVARRLIEKASTNTTLAKVTNR